VALQAVEFWSTLCDYELELLEEGEDSEEQNHGFIRAVTPHLVPVLLEQLTKQEEGQEQDESTWNLAMSAGTCLGLMARVAGNDVVPVVRDAGVLVGWGWLGGSLCVCVCVCVCGGGGLSGSRQLVALVALCLLHLVNPSSDPTPHPTHPPQVMPFVTANIAKQGGPDDWRWREAATFAFGSVVEGPSPASLVPMVQQAMPYLFQVRAGPVRRGASARCSAPWVVHRGWLLRLEG